MMRSAFAWLFALAFGLSAAAMVGAADGAKTTIKTGGAYEVEVVRSIAYYDGPDADPTKHQLDLYLPKEKKGFPVFFFIHGGAWSTGDKSTLFDVYGRIARTFARNGIGAVLTNYRLSPKVQHPAHIQDVAKAFAWTYAHIGEYGGRSDQIIVGGHSAGGHLAALLATDPQYLEAEHLSFKQIRAVVPMSGVYTIGSGRLFDRIFGADDAIRQQASPTNHVTGKHPPALIIYADGDFPTCDRMSEDFCKALRRCQCDSETLCIPKRDHITIIVRLQYQEDPAFQAVLEFIAKQVQLPLATQEVEASVRK